MEPPEIPGRSADGMQSRLVAPNVAAQEQMQPDPEPLSPPCLCQLITSDLARNLLSLLFQQFGTALERDSREIALKWLERHYRRWFGRWTMFFSAFPSANQINIGRSLGEAPPPAFHRPAGQVRCHDDIIEFCEGKVGRGARFSI